MATYHLELDGTQAHVVVAALDLFARIGTGQLHEVVDVLRVEKYTTLDGIKTAEIAMDAVKMALTGLPRNASQGVSNLKVSPRFKVAYDIECVLRQKIAQTEKHGKHSVWHDDPFQVCADVPLAKCTVEE